MATFCRTWSATVLRVVVTLAVLVGNGEAWHGISNENFHCWPLAANANNPTPYPSCPGIDIHWVLEPPSEVKAEEAFNVTYSLQVDDAFYAWAVIQGIFNNAGTTGGFSNNATGAKTWCQSTPCPADVTQADQSNCCIHHVNVHSCPLAQTHVVASGLCGPWIPSNGSIFTHSQVMVGPISTGQWSSSVLGLYEVGLTSMIAHFKLAGMHIAIEKEVQVLPKTVCGDEVCESEDQVETCGNCPSDCGQCPLEPYAIALIVVSVIIICVVILSVFGYMQYQRRKLLWDESWIIAADAIVESTGDGGQFGSRLLGSQLLGSRADVNSVRSSSLATEAIKRQVFATLAYVDGRQMAVKKIRNCRFQLTKHIRCEVRDVRSMEHPNLCRFLGGCVEPGKACILSEYCPKGSLMDVLQNDAIPLSWSFKSETSLIPS